MFPEPETLFDDYSGRGRAEREQNISLAKSFTDRLTKIATPPYLNDEQKAQWDAYYQPRNESLALANLTGKDLVRWRYQRYMHDYLGTVLAIDKGVGRLRKYLNDEGFAENILVIYSSDQG